MPELPEVETVIRSLSVLNGNVFSSVKIFNNSLLKNSLKEEFFSNTISGQRINEIKRKGKYIFMILDDWVIISHLRMTGKYFVEDIPGITDKEKNLALIFFFENGKKLPFYDPRGFATFHLQKRNEYENLYPYNKIGLDLMNDYVDSKYLFESFKGKKIPIKSALLEQNVISGIGNIYASEILFDINVHPLTLTNLLSENKLKDLLLSSKKILGRAIDLKGSSIVEFVSPSNEKGLFQNELNVYGRNGENCFKCSKKIIKIFIDNRSTFFCEICQPMYKVKALAV